MLDETVTTHLLYDCYGALLTERQRRILEMRLFDDWSLGEIAEALRISRQAVHDTVTKTVSQLEGYETKLGILASHLRRREKIEQLEVLLTSKYSVSDDVVQLIRALQ